MVLEYHGKLEFPINGRFLHISEIVVDCKIFSKTVVFGHFGQYQEVKCPPPWDVEVLVSFYIMFGKN